MLDPMCGALATTTSSPMTDELITATHALAAAVRVAPRSDRKGGQMAPRIVVIGGGSFQWVPKLFCDLVNTPSLAEAEIVLEDIDPEPLPTWPTSRSRWSRRRGYRDEGLRRPPTSGPRSKAPTTWSSASRPAGSRACATTSRSRNATASSSRSATPSARAASAARCATSPCSSASRATWRTSAPTRGCSTSPTR